MESFNIYILIQISLIIMLIVFTLLIFKVIRTIILEERILRFSVFSISDKPVTLFEDIENFYNKFILRISKVLKKSKVLSDYSKIYNKYFGKSRFIVETPIDVVSNKFVFSLGTILIAVISDFFRGSNFSFVQVVFTFLLGFFIPDIMLCLNYKRMQKNIEDDFLKAVIIMSNAFKSGRSIMQAVEIVANELDGFISLEFKKMHMDLLYGLDLEVVFDRLAARTKLEETKYLASSLVIVNKTGGDIVKIFSSIERSFFEKKKLNDELKSVTALSSFVFKILVSVPFIIVILISIMNPSYFVPFISTIVGKILLGIMTLIYILYIIIVNKVIKIRE